MPIQFDDPFADPSAVDQPQSTGFGDVVSDLALSPLRGAEGFLRGVASIGNVIPGVEYDLGESFLGDAKTTTGKFATGLFEFAAGFVPAVGLVGKAGKLAQASKFSTVAKAGRALQGTVVKGLAAGGVQDFAAYEGTEDRLSNLIQEFPGLQNPITEYLAADEDDSELEGRFKNVLEGAGLGAATDLLLAGLKGLRAGRGAKLAGEDPEAAFRAAAPEDSAQSALEGLQRRLDGDPTQAGEDAVSQLLREDPEVDDITQAAVRRDAEQRAAAARGETPEPLPVEEAGAALGIEAPAFREALAGRKVQSSEELVEIMEKGGANLTKSVENRGVAEVIRAAEDTVGPLPKGTADTVTQAEQLEQAAERLGDIMGTGSQAQAIQASARQGLEDITRVNRTLLAQEAVATRMFDELVSKDLDSLADDDLVAALAPVVELQQFNRGIRSEQGRGLQSAQTPQARLIGILEQAGAPKDPKRLRKLLKKVQDAHGEGGLEGAAASMRTLQDATVGKRVLGVVNELFINNVLGGARTLVVNGITPTALSVITPLQNMVGGALTGNGTVMKTAMREIMTMHQSVQESFSLARKAFKTGQGSLMPTQSIRDDVGRFNDAITAENLGLDGGVAGGAVDFFGRMIRIPTRFLQGTDEFVKQMNYRTTSKGRLWEQAMEQGLDAQASAEFVEDGMRKLLIDGQKASTDKWLAVGRQEGLKLGKAGAELEDFAEQFAAENFDESLSDIANAAAQRAEEVTFTAPLKPGSLGAKVQDISNTVPLAKLVVPFVKTPVNIAQNAAQRVDVIGVAETLLKTRFFTKQAPELAESAFRFSRDMASGNPRLKAEAVGRVSTGFAVATSFGVMAAEGKITGRGPSDPEQRRLLMEAGWQPYSIKTGDGYVSYARLDPFATIIGTVADLFDYGRYSDESDQEGLQSAFGATAFALANNVTNKTYLQGLGDFIGAVSDTDRKLIPFLQQQTAALVTPNLVGQLAGLDDPYMREARGLADRVQSRIPGMADGLPPMRNVLGEPIRRQNTQFSDDPGRALWDIMSPIAYRETSDDTVTREMANLRHGFSPPRKTLAGEELLEYKNSKGQSAYDRWLELHGQVKIQGRTLRQEMQRLFRSPEYQRFSDQSTAQGPSDRVRAVKSVISRYRGEALDKMQQEYPELRNTLRANERSRLASRPGPAPTDTFSL